MADVLDHNEIDALLAAVAAETGGEDAGSPAALSAPAQELGKATDPQGPGPMADYDFRRPERVGKDHIRALSSIHDAFARSFGATLSGFLRTIVDFRVVGVEQLTYGEFVHSLPNPTTFVILQAPPLEGQMCLEISPLITFPIIDRLLGGSNSDTYIPQRPLTAIEWRLVRRLVVRALEHLTEVWRNLADAKFEIVETESNPQLVHIVAPSEVVVYITFEIKMGPCAGTMSICIPFNTIESVLSKLATQSWLGNTRKTATEKVRQRIVRNLSRTKVDLIAYLGRARITLSELRSLRPGDMIQLEKQTREELIVQVEGRNKYAGLPGQWRGQRAVRISRLAEMDERL